jgi:hypothetical protein
MDSGNDAALGLLLDKYGEDSTMNANDSEGSELEKDDEVEELKEALTEMISEFKGESEQRASKLDQ